MKKLLLLGCAISTLFSSYSQNTFPTNGAVGIGTNNPSAKLDVNGNMRVDSSVYVKDSVVINRDLRVKQDVKFVGETIMKGDAVAKSDFKILGITKMKGDGFVEGTFKFKGLEDPTITEDRFLMINSNGKVKSFTKPGLISNIYNAEPCVGFTDGQTSGGVPAPIWNHASGIGHGILWTGHPCPAWVGINIANPEAELDVRGSGFFNDFVGIRLGNGYNFTGNNALEIDGASSGKDLFLFKNNNGEMLKLKENGTLYAREIKVRDNAFPDYVFKDDYKLMPLTNLKEYIKSNGHLPNMPTAEEVKEDGVALGKTNHILVEKVEELTLYTLEQQELINQLQQQLKELQKEIANIKK